MCIYRRHPQEEWGKYPPKPKKIIVFSSGVENDKVPGRRNRKWVKRQFSIEIFVCKNLKISQKFQSPLDFRTNAQMFATRFLNKFRIIKEFH